MDIKAERDKLLDLHDQLRGAPRNRGAVLWGSMDVLHRIRQKLPPEDGYASEKLAIVKGIFDDRQPRRSWEEERRDLVSALDALEER